MIRKLVLALGLFLGLASAAQAQNPQCPTRPFGDSTNACASTAFVQGAVVAILPSGNSCVLSTNSIGVLGCNTVLPTHSVTGGITLPGGTTTNSGGTTPTALTFARCVRPEQFGAKNDASTDDTSAVIQAANLAQSFGIGLCLTSGAGYSVHPISIGGAQNAASGTCTGSISGTALTITSGCSIDIATGQTVTGAGVTGGTTVTAYGVRTIPSVANYNSNGMQGAYTVSASSAVGPITLTFTAPSFTGTITGTALNVTSVASGVIKVGQNLTCTGCALGTYITALAGGSGGTGGYTVNISQSVASTATMSTHPSATASPPPFIEGDDGVNTKFVGNGAGGPYPNQRLITIVSGFASVPFTHQTNWNNFQINAQNYGFGLGIQGLTGGSISNIRIYNAISATGCGQLWMGTVLTPVIYAHIRSLTSQSNAGTGVCIDGNDGSGGYNVQAIDAIGLYSEANGGAGWIIDYAGFACYECESESNTSNSVLMDHSLHMRFDDFYTEGNGGAFAGTANTTGLSITGKLDDGVNTTLQGCLTCRIRIFNATVPGFQSFPSGTCVWSDQVGGVTLTGTANCKWNVDVANMVNVYGTVTYNTTSVTNAAAALIGFVGAPTVPNQTYAALGGTVKVTVGLGPVLPVVVANSTNFNIWHNGNGANNSITSLPNVGMTLSLRYPLN